MPHLFRRSTNETKSIKDNHIGAIDGWRGIAILFVLVEHAFEASPSPLINHLTRLGSTGVGLFFALSGFLITSLLLGEQAKRGHIHLLKFYTRRAFRILPPVTVYLLVLLCLRHWHYLQVSTLQVTSSFLLFRNYLPLDRGWGWYTMHLWSLMVEEHFYLFWPLVLRYMKVNVRFLIGFALMVASWRALSFHFHLLARVCGPGRTDVRIDALLWGCILAIVFAHPQWRIKLQRMLSGKVMLCLLALEILPTFERGPHYYSFYEPIVLSLLLVWPILHAKSMLRIILDSPVLVSLGKISYSHYLWQGFWLLFSATPKPFPRLQSFPANIILALLCAIASFYLVEQPFIKLGRLAGDTVAPRRTPPVTAGA